MKVPEHFFFRGRVALYAILEAAGIGPGDEVIVPGFTCVVVPNSVIYRGAVPVYADIDSETFNIDPKEVERKITPETRAIVIQHTFGVPADIKALKKMANNNGLLLIEDSCHALGSLYEGKEVGGFGDAAFFSSQWSKPVTTGLGGFTEVNNKNLKKEMDRLYGQYKAPPTVGSALMYLQFLTYSLLFRPSLFWFLQSVYRGLSSMGILVGSSTEDDLLSRMPPDFKSTMAPWQIRLLKRRLAEADIINSHRRTISSLYEELLEASTLKPYKIPPGTEPVFLRYPVLINNKYEVLKEAKKQSIELGDWFVSPVHPNLDGWQRAGYEQGMCPASEDICQRIINLPTHAGVSQDAARRIVDFVINIKA